MILDTIAATAKERVAAAKEALPLTEQIARARELDSNTGFPFEQALAKKRMSFICEVKKASPSKGLIAPEFPYVQIAKEYETAGADAISVLTEPAYFQGKNEYLTEIRQAVKIPLLRKDFTVDEYMIYEAKNNRSKCSAFNLCHPVTDAVVRVCGNRRRTWTVGTGGSP